MSKAVLSVETQFNKIISDLESLKAMSKEVGQAFEENANQAGEAIRQQEQRTNRFFEGMKRQGSGLVKNLKDDFKALMGLNMVEQSLKLSNQFKGSVKEAFQLSDAIRKFGGALGIAQSQFGAFQTKLVKGLGDIGLSSEAASNVLQGLMGTGVKGEGALMEYSKGAGMLASVANQKGTEGDIAKGMATVLRARGVDPNDQKAVGGLSQDLNRVYQATGKGPKEILDAMDTLFSDMASDLRKKVTQGTMIEMATAGQVAGPGAMKFLDEYLSKSAIERLPMDQMGMSGVIGKDGRIDFEKLQKAINGITSQIGGDPEMAARTLGISDEAAKGLVRLRDSMDQVKEATNAVRNSTAELGQSYKASTGFGEAFQGNLNKIKSLFAGPLSAISNTGSNLLQKSSESTVGSAAVVGGAGLLAAVLAGGGLRNLKGVLGTAAKSQAAEAALGKETIPVYVTNIGELSAAMMGGDAAGGLMGKFGKFGKGAAALAGKAGLVGAAGAAGYGIGSLAEPYVTGGLDKISGKEDQFGTQWNILERFFLKLDTWTGGSMSGNTRPIEFDVQVKSVDPGVKAKAKTPRGAAQ